MNLNDFDAQNYLKTEEDLRLFLEASFLEDPGDGSGIRLALREIARANLAIPELIEANGKKL